MGSVRLPRQCFLWGMSVIYLFAFSSLYVQIPGLYGNDGILPARRMLKYMGKPLLEQLWDSPTFLWLGPKLGLDTQQGMELICLLGIILSFGAMVFEALRDSLVFFFLWTLYLSVYQVGQVFLYFQWDNLLLETGFLTALVAPLHLFKWKSTLTKHHDGITFWLVRWLLFRLMFASGVVKLTSRCPTWWSLTALTYHYETQCIPTPVAWFAHQLPDWFQKLSVVGTYVIEIAVPFLFFIPLRRLQLFSFYLQVLLQLLIILTGNYNFFNLLTIVLSLPLLDDFHVYFWTGQSKKKKSERWTLMSWIAIVIELAVYSVLVYFTILYFELGINWEQKAIMSSVGFTYHEFNRWLKMATICSIWIGVLSLTWEIITAMFNCACVRGFFWKMWATVQWAVFAVAAASMFTVSLVPFTYIEYDANSRLWPAVRKMYEAVDRYQLVNSYGLFRSMTGVGGRPEVVLEGSYDKETWTEIDFMYKPGNVSITPPIVVPHQPRVDWQMWFAALGPHTRSPWFSSLVQRLLQGKKDVIELIQADGVQYPFSKSPPTFIRAKLYKYWYTLVNKDGSLPQNWWRRQYFEEFFPTVFLGDPNLESMLSHYGLKDRVSTKRISDAFLPTILRTLRENVRTLTGPQFVWSLFCSGAAICLMKGFFSGTHSNKHKPVFETKKSKGKDTGSGMAKNEQVKKKADRSQESLEPKQPESSEGGFADSDKSTKKRK